MNLTAKDIQGLIIKLGLKNITHPRETKGEYWLDEKLRFKVKMPNLHGGSKTVSPQMLKACRDTVGLGHSDYLDLVNCPMSAEEYADRVRASTLVGPWRSQ